MLAWQSFSGSFASSFDCGDIVVVVVVVITVGFDGGRPYWGGS